MLDEQARRQFIDEVWRRYEEVQQWAIANWPDKEHPLSTSDFVEGRKEILGLGLAREARLSAPAEAEPEQGGAQYIEVTPAPWP
ncbi:hypothetical protein LJR289_001268 [Pseudoduganella sp. LjRoot289]|uniref:hypothetical protein n=1 Tax=Pseudoduganella sp. LjRoot289 TaxID=3342314 RepID=UPI003ECCCF19